MDLRSHRTALRLSQSKLARLSGVSRFKICLYELGDGALTPNEQDRIEQALLVEAERLRDLSDSFKLEDTNGVTSSKETG
jgi:predicted transcriptional regulator